MAESENPATISTPTREKLPVLETVRLAYVAIGDNFATLVRATGWWAAIAAAAIALFAVVSSMVPPLEDFTPELRSIWAPVIAGSSLLLGLVIGVTWAGAVVAWHRFLLLDEKPSGSPAAHWRITLRYAFLSGALLCIAFAISMIGVTSIKMAEQSDDPDLSFIAWWTMIAAIALLANRFSLVYPAMAVGETRMTFVMSWKVTANNTWRLFLTAMLVIVPIGIAVDIAVSALTSIAVEPIGSNVASSFGFLLTLFANAAAVSSVYSLAYRHFVGRVVDDPADVFT